MKKFQEKYDIEYFLTEYIGWPYETLYKLFYFSFFNNIKWKNVNIYFY